MIEYGEAFLEGKDKCLSEYFGKSQRQGRISVESSNQTTEERSPFGWVVSFMLVCKTREVGCFSSGFGSTPCR